MAESEPSNLLQRFKVVLLGEQSGGYCQFKLLAKSIACYLLHYLSYGIMQYTAPESILQRQLHTYCPQARSPIIKMHRAAYKAVFK